jgi:transcriptional regulator with XRE-family HTH domain
MNLKDQHESIATTLTGPQLRAARGLINMSIAELAQVTKLALNTIRRAEASDGLIQTTQANADRLRSVMEEFGVSFVPADEVAGAGVRFRSEGPLGDRQTTRRRKT